MEKTFINYETQPESYSTGFITVNLIQYENYIYSQVNGAADGAAVLVINKAKEILLIQAVRPAVGEISWEIPRGTIDEGESPHEAASRELREETGFSLSPDKLFPLGYINPDTGVLNIKIHLFIHKTASFPHQMEYKPDGFEVKNIKWVGLSNVAEAIRQNIITDSVTIAALGKAKLTNIL